MILNAMDAISKEGTLSIETNYIDRSDIVEIIFSDTGIGIKKEDLKRIGEPFFTTKPQNEGFGLGLTTSYGIVGVHKGKIDVKSSVGKGTTFIIQLPVKQKV